MSRKWEEKETKKLMSNSGQYPYQTEIDNGGFIISRDRWNKWAKLQSAKHCTGTGELIQENSGEWFCLFSWDESCVVPIPDSTGMDFKQAAIATSQIYPTARLVPCSRETRR